MSHVSKMSFLIVLCSSFVHFSSNHPHAQEIKARKHHYQNVSKHQTESSASQEKKIYFTFRLGQGGFRDDRLPIGKLGGGQLTLDIKPAKYPVAI